MGQRVKLNFVKDVVLENISFELSPLDNRICGKEEKEKYLVQRWVRDREGRMFSKFFSQLVKSLDCVVKGFNEICTE